MVFEWYEKRAFQKAATRYRKELAKEQRTQFRLKEARLRAKITAEERELRRLHKTPLGKITEGSISIAKGLLGTPRKRKR